MGKRTVGDIYLRRYKTCDIPRDEEGATNFLMDVYKEKDELLGHYKETDGQEFTDQKVEVIKVYNGIFRIYSSHKIIMRPLHCCYTISFLLFRFQRKLEF